MTFFCSSRIKVFFSGAYFFLVLFQQKSYLNHSTLEPFSHAILLHSFNLSSFFILHHFLAANFLILAHFTIFSFKIFTSIKSSFIFMSFLPPSIHPTTSQFLHSFNFLSNSFSFGFTLQRIYKSFFK